MKLRPSKKEFKGLFLPMLANSASVFCSSVFCRVENCSNFAHLAITHMKGHFAPRFLASKLHFYAQYKHKDAYKYINKYQTKYKHKDA